MKTIMIKGFYGQDNLGDEILLLSLMRWIARNDFIARVSVGKHRARLKEVLSLSGGKAVFFSSSIFSEMYQLLRSDVLLIGGGGLFPGGRVGLPLRLLVLAGLGRILGKTTVMVGVGVNPIKSRLTKAIWRLLAATCKIITVRDNNSLKTLVGVLGEHQSREKVQRCADLVFTLPPEDFYAAEKPKENIIAIVVAQPWSDNERGDPRLDQRYNDLQDGLARCIEQSAHAGLKTILIPFYYPGDIKFANELSARCRLGTAEVCDDQTLSGRICQIAASKLVLTMRFHGLVLGALFSKKLLAIAYDYKMDELANDLGVDDNVVHLGIRQREFYGNEVDVDFYALSARLDQAIKSADLPEYSEQRIEIIRLAKNNIYFLERALGVGGSTAVQKTVSLD